MAGTDAEKIAQEAINAIADKIKNLNTLNIIVAGKTGVGKSTLINSVFKEELADTGMGKPVTTHMRKINKKGVPLAIYDTKGFELGKEVQSEVKQEIIDTISKGLAMQDINKAIHFSTSDFFLFYSHDLPPHKNPCKFRECYFNKAFCFTVSANTMISF